MMKSRPKLTVVQYAWNEGSVPNFADDNVHESSGLPAGEIDVITLSAARDGTITSAYNRALKSSRSRFILFTDRILNIQSQNWAAHLIAEMDRTDFAILGVIGATEINLGRQQGMWYKSQEAGQIVGAFNYRDQFNHHQKASYTAEITYTIPVVCVPGMFMFVAKDRIKVNFDEDFNGSSYYDISFCLKNFEKGVRLGVVPARVVTVLTEDIFKQFEHDRQLFVTKHPKSYRAAAIINIPNITPEIPRDTSSRIHIIIPTKNKIDLLKKCIQSILEKTSYKCYTIWIADTGSDTENMLALEEYVYSVNSSVGEKICLLKFNFYNFSKINNAVVNFIQTRADFVDEDFILFCNNDIQLLNDSISGCLENYFRLESKGVHVGTLGIRLHYADNSIQHAGIDLQKQNNRILLGHKELKKLYRDVENTESCVGCTGAFLFTKLSTFISAGMFNENYIDCYQDVEFNLQCLLDGKTNVYIGSLVAYHYESQSRSEDPKKKFNEQTDWSNTLFPFILTNMHSLEQHF